MTDPEAHLTERRLRVCIGAYACGPGAEPEAAAGWAFATAAARRHEVWVVTRRRFQPAISAALADDAGLAARLRVSYVDAGERVLRLKRRSWDVYWYYVLWQRLMLREARRLHQEVGFDVAHHVTWANDWLPCGLARLDGVPLVWGPVGGASRTPYWRLRRWLGVRGVATEVARDALTAAPRRVWGDRAARRAAVVVAQNPAVAARFAHARHVVVEPNAALTPGELPARAVPAGDGSRSAVFVGRLLAWKGARLAVAAVACTSDWNLTIFGTGYQRAGLERFAGHLGIADRVTFAGHRPRPEVLAAMASADAMLFPTMHDQCSWAVAEASTIGVPVVCLPLGGPPVVAHVNGFVAALDGDVARNVAEQLALAGEQGGVPHDRWSAERLEELVDGWYATSLHRSTGTLSGERSPVPGDRRRSADTPRS